MMKKSLVIEYSETPLAVDVHIFKILQVFYLKIVHHFRESNCIQDTNIFKFIRKTTISCCQQIGDGHQMPYTNRMTITSSSVPVLVYAISAVFLLWRRILDHFQSWRWGGAVCGTNSEPKILRLVRFLDESEAIMSRWSQCLRQTKCGFSRDGVRT